VSQDLSLIATGAAHRAGAILTEPDAMAKATAFEPQGSPVEFDRAESRALEPSRGGEASQFGDRHLALATIRESQPDGAIAVGIIVDEFGTRGATSSVVPREAHFEAPRMVGVVVAKAAGAALEGGMSALTKSHRIASGLSSAGGAEVCGQDLLLEGEHERSGIFDVPTTAGDVAVERAEDLRSFRIHDIPESILARQYLRGHVAAGRDGLGAESAVRRTERHLTGEDAGDVGLERHEHHEDVTSTSVGQDRKAAGIALPREGELAALSWGDDGPLRAGDFVHEESPFSTIDAERVAAVLRRFGVGSGQAQSLLRMHLERCAVEANETDADLGISTQGIEDGVVVTLIAEFRSAEKHDQRENSEQDEAAGEEDGGLVLTPRGV
jgi:hypothetical protein